MRSSGGPTPRKGAPHRPGPELAAALADWAVPRAEMSVLDPECGPGDLLAAAARRLRGLGDRDPRVAGITAEPDDAPRAAQALADAGAQAGVVMRGSLLERAPGEAPYVDAVLCSPQFVRYQKLPKVVRDLVRLRTTEAGVRLGPLFGSWAATLVHACAFLRPGGRLAFVAPAELATAAYGRALIGFLHRRFGRLRLVSLTGPTHAGPDQRLLLVLAADHGRRTAVVEACRATLADVPSRAAGGLDALPVSRLDAGDVSTARTSLREAWLSEEARRLIPWLRTSRSVSRLGQHAKVATGYVTGSNDYFHLAPDEALDLEVKAPHLRRALFRSRALLGLEVTIEDWAAAAESGDAGLLFAPTTESDPFVRAYLEQGVAAGVPERAKARHRSPWWRVTRTAPPDLVLTALATKVPRLAVNAAQAAVSNTLHAVTLRPGSGSAEPLTIAAAAWSSLTLLSAELAGKPMGGGLLKLEPSAAQQLALPLPAGQAAPVAAPVARAIDRAARAGDAAAATAAADAAFLSGMAGIGSDGALVLRAALDTLVDDRLGH